MTGALCQGTDEFGLRYSSSRRRAADGADALAKDDDVVQGFAANGPNQSFGKTVLPRRARRDRFIPNVHCAEAPPHDGTEDAVSVADQVPWLIPNEQHV